MDLGLVAAHAEWADRRLWLAVEFLPEAEWTRPLASSYGSLAATVEHLVATEWTWLQRLAGHSPAALGPPGGARDRARLAGLWPTVWAGWRQAAGRDPAERLRYATTTGAPQENTVGEVLLHVALHSAAYRGQAAALLRALGRTPPNTDLMAFLRGDGAGARSGAVRGAPAAGAGGAPGASARGAADAAPGAPAEARG